MKKARAKLQSRRGASITFALLLFLVCAVVSSVVVVAGSAVGGRMSQMAAMDQRYYAVTSAAELLRSIFDGRTVRVTTDNATGGQTVDPGTDAVLGHASMQLMSLLSAGGEELTGTFDLSPDKGDALKCSITETVKKSGLLEYAITNGNYTLRVTFASNRRVIASATTEAATTTAVTWKLNGVRRGGGATT